MKKKLRKIIKISFWSMLILFLIIVLSTVTISRNAKGKIFDTTSLLPKNKVGLVLGTVKYLANGRVNLYYTYRVEAAVKLFKANKIDVILVSGDNGMEGYDEPTEFKKDLLARGIPEDKIFLDYAGFRTLDSMVRVKEIFGQSSVTVISQKFHNERAIYLAKYKGVNAIAFNARDVSGRYGIKVQLREYLARVKVFVDLMLGKQPKFLGEKVNIP